MQRRATEDRKTTYKQNLGRDYTLPGIKYWIIFFTTILLIVSMVASLVVVLCLKEDDDYSAPITNMGGNKPSGGGSVESIVNNNTNVKTKTGINLPCVTASGKFLSTSAANVSAIEGIASDCAILVDINGNVSVAEKNADAVVHPASLTKVMTLLVASENLQNAGELLTVTQDMLDRRTQLEGSGELVDNTSALNADGDVESIEIVGKSITVEDALYLINYQSDTVACLMVAECVAGSEEAFVAKMNAKADAIGLTKTNFVNCTGLTESSGEHNKTTAREMAAIMACALNNATARKVITSYQKYSVDIYEGGKKTEYTIPFFADWQNYPKRLNGKTKVGDVNILGGKTGYEDIPSSCFVTYGKNVKTGKEYVCVTIGKYIGSESEAVYNEPSTNDTRTVYKNYAK